MTLRITRLSLVNFRSYAKATLEFDGRPVAFSGPNGAGKTNLIEAISMFSPGRGLRRVEGGALGRTQAGIGWKLGLRLTQNGTIHDLETQAHSGEARSVRIDDKATSQVALARLMRVLWLVPSMDRLWIDSASERRKFFDRIVLSFRPEHGEAVLEYEKAMRGRNRLLKDGVRDAYWYDALETRMANAGARIMQGRADAVALLNATMSARDTRYFPVAVLGLAYDGKIAVEDLTTLWRDMRPRDIGAGVTTMGPHRVELEALYSTKGQPARLCSTGEQKAMLVSLILANARALLDEGQSPILLLDEVAAHLDADRRAALYEEILDLDVHAFMTGTEVGLYESLGERGQNVAINDTASIRVC